MRHHLPREGLFGHARVGYQVQEDYYHHSTPQPTCGANCGHDREGLFKIHFFSNGMTVFVEKSFLLYKGKLDMNIVVAKFAPLIFKKDIC